MNIEFSVFRAAVELNKESKQTFGPLVNYIGKRILEIKLSDENLILTFEDNNKIKIYDAAQSCCEHRYMTCDDKLEEFVGTKFCDAVLKPAIFRDEGGGSHDIQFLDICTDLGTFQIVNHNSHNGYYSGFQVEVSEEKTSLKYDKRRNL